jgi:hypothetical protein
MPAWEQIGKLGTFPKLMARNQGTLKPYRLTLTMPRICHGRRDEARADHITDEPHRPPHDHAHAADRGAGADLESARAMKEATN